MDIDKLVVVVDFDHTLAKTTLLKEKMRGLVETLGVTDQIFDKAYVGVRPYNHKRHAQVIAQLLNRSKKEELEIATAITEALRDFVQCIYEDAKRFLLELKLKEAKTILLTYGDQDWQQAKIEASGLGSLFDDIIVTPVDKLTVFNQWATNNRFENQRVYFISDNAKEIQPIIETLPSIRVIQIVRADGKYQDKVNHIPVCQTLDEVLDIMNLYEGAAIKSDIGQTPVVESSLI